MDFGRKRLIERMRSGIAIAGLGATLALVPSPGNAFIMNKEAGTRSFSAETLLERIASDQQGIDAELRDMSTDERHLERLVQRLRMSTVMIETDDAIGSGVIIRRTSSESVILTNRHVVMSDDDQSCAANIVVHNNGHDARAFGVLLAPHGLDLALVVVNDDMGPPVRIARRSPRQGNSVLVMGAPLGVEDSVSRGIVSNFRSRTTDEGFSYDAIQTDAAINPGNSGGGLFLESTGELVGIPSFKPLLNPITPADSIGYALPVSLVLQMPAREWRAIPIAISDPST